MDPKYIETNESEEFETSERCHIVEFLNDETDRSFSLARARVEPGITTSWHRLKDTTEIFYILQGEGVVNVGEEFEQNVKVGDTIKIPKDTAQRMVNSGDTDLIFLCYCMPAFGAECYEELE